LKQRGIDDIYYSRGLAYELSGNIKQAIEDYESALIINPSNTTAFDSYKRITGKNFDLGKSPTLWLVAIGVDNYQNDYMFDPLGFSVNGAHGLAKYFQDQWNLPDANVSILVNQNAKRKSILDSLEQFVNPLKVGENDMIIVFFSGHGKMVKDRIGVCAWDYSSEKNLITDTDITNILNRSPAKHKLCLIEACRSSNEMAENVDPEIVNKLNQQRRKISGGLAYITSTKAGSKSYGSSDELGVFTKHLLEGLKKGFADENRDKAISVEEIFNYVQDKVSRETNGKQVPQINQEGYDKAMPIIMLSQ
jgi:uncharacterized caspase-like protein